jgi:UDP-N-acetylmuramate--alanine ligase
MEIHFIGINGVGMSSLAFLFSKFKFTVTGSDISLKRPKLNYKSLSIKVFDGHSANNISDHACVVISSAVSKDNVELLEAEERGLIILKRSQAIQYLNDHIEKKVIAIGGTNGKGSVVALLANIFTVSGLDPVILCGAKMLNFDSAARYGQGSHFIVESCEYDRSFLDVKAESVVISNIEADHLDYYKGGITEIGYAFADFIKTSCNSSNGIKIINCNNPKTQKLLIDALKPINNLELTGLSSSNWYFKTTDESKFTQKVTLFYKKDVFDEYVVDRRKFPFVENLFQSVILSQFYGINKKDIREGICSYRGLERRFQNIELRNDNVLIYDYSSHYSTFEKAIKIIRELYPQKRLVSIVGLRQSHRTKRFLKEYSYYLSKSDICFLLPVLKGLGDPSDTLFDIRVLSKAIERLNCQCKVFDDCSHLLPEIDLLSGNQNQVFYLGGTGSTEAIFDALLRKNQNYKYRSE